MCLSLPKSLWGAGLPSTLLQGGSHHLKGEEELRREGCVVFAPSASLLGSCCLKLVSSSFATCALVLGEPQGACLCEQRCRGQVTAEG